ncbi:MAG: hypothetical protein M0Z87_10770 [Actinomycetota bacterium]|nr:hypothetical protein [Actinomycetota bacterium]
MTLTERVKGYELRLDLSYDPASDLWVDTSGCTDASGSPGSGVVVIGLDPLGAETSGTLAQLSLAAPGAEVRRGGPLGSLEAEKFVGPLLAPLSGTLVEVNSEALAQPAKVHHDPYGTWLVKLRPSDLGADLDTLVRGEATVREWFESRVDDYRRQGVLAE